MVSLVASNQVLGSIDPLTLTPRTTAHLDPARQREADVQAAGKAYEGYFIAQLLKTMHKTVPEGLLQGHREDVMQDLYHEELGRLAAEQGGLGWRPFIEGALRDQMGLAKVVVPLQVSEVVNRYRG